MEQQSLALRHRDIADGDLAGAAVFLRIEGDLLALGQATQSGALERSRMNEDVLAAVIRLNEAEAFLVVVKFYGTRCHGDILLLDEVHVSPRCAFARLGARLVEFWRV